MLLYALLHLTGYELPLDELKKFRQLNSKTPGHPEYGHTPGVETTTGPLGQGFANGVGMAIVGKYLETYFNRPRFKIFNYRVFGIVSDGDLMEGVSSEAASLAGHLQLGNIVYLYDDNQITIDGPTSLAFSEDVGARFRAYGWFVEEADGNDLDSIDAALRKCLQQNERPSLIKVRTDIGYGSPNKQGTAEVHGSPLGEDEVKRTKEAYGWNYKENFYIPKDALRVFRQAVDAGQVKEGEWKQLVEAYRNKHPGLYATLEQFLNGAVSLDWERVLPVFSPSDGKIATRAASGKTLESLTQVYPFMIGGSADLTPSNNTKPKKAQPFSASNRLGRYIHFGVREHAMGSIMNGIALSNFRTYGGTFLVFSDYMRPSIRLAALMGVPVIYVFTHDSIGLGEDGPTHQPIEHLASLRAIPNMWVIRPADANETAYAWRIAMERKDGPTAIVLSRQGLPVIDRSVYAPVQSIERGGYVLAQDESPEILLIATGSEVHLILGAYEVLRKEGIPSQVVNLACWELFERQSDEYRREVIPPGITHRVAVEAGSSLGWAKYVGNEGTTISIDRFGASAPLADVMEEYGFTVKNVVEKVKQIVVKKKRSAIRVESE